MSSPSPPSSSTMLRLLGADSGSRFALLSRVPFFTLPSLAQTCRSWTNWINTENAMLKQTWSVALNRAAAFLACPWARLHVSGLSLGEWGERTNPFRDVSGLYAVLEEASTFRHLRSFHVHVMPCIEERVWGRCFTQLAPRLETFSITCPLFSDAADETVAAAARHLDKLVNLTALSITGHFNAADQIDFSALPKLPRLSHFSMMSGVLGFLVSADQLVHLCNCKQLVSIGGGFARPGPQFDGQELNEDEQLRTMLWEQHVIAFIESRFPAEGPPLPPMTRIALPALTPAVWSRLTRLSSLEALEPYKWIGFGAEEWSKLSMFTALRRVMLQPVNFGETLDASLFAAPLSTCATIESLDFGRVLLTEQNFSLLMKGLSLLQSLSFSMSILESLVPLSFAPALSKLSFHHCCRFDDHAAALDVRRMLPALPALTELAISSSEVLPAEELAALTAALLARMPALRPEYLEQDEPGWGEEEEQPQEPVDGVNVADQPAGPPQPEQ